ncbi:MAG TPA: DUF2238 domain-containing protein [Bacteroidales bacterium]|nr:DUF2238 domain-containing protein [Bacteroidales bacterium]HSA43962.1 DUF2238 domain-containing protein [Bacteroidales bacterium]
MNFHGRAKKLLITGIYWVLLILSLIHPVYPDEQWLQHTASLAATLIMLWFILHPWLSDRSFLLFALFMSLHTLGARWIYTYVPYESWIHTVSGMRINEVFGWERNHYDRLVHFAYGLLLFIPIREILMKRFSYRLSQASFTACCFIVASGAVYELFEWSLIYLMDPWDAENYNGQQGDRWDAQKDMALAALGTIVAAGAAFLSAHLPGLRKHSDTLQEKLTQG